MSSCDANRWMNGNEPFTFVTQLRINHSSSSLIQNVISMHIFPLLANPSPLLAIIIKFVHIDVWSKSYFPYSVFECFKLSQHKRSKTSVKIGICHVAKWYIWQRLEVSRDLSTQPGQ
jgi:hypothetical protein